jgi:hypothetical protein
VVLVGRRAGVVGRREGDLVALGIEVHPLLEPHRVVAVPGQGDRHLLVGQPLVAHLGEQVSRLR